LPIAYKQVISKKSNQFKGFQQHDAQEHLSCLLDGLHEDLNRVLEKPYTEGVETDGKSENEIATESWDIYLKRNQSIIVDIFHGLLKSSVTCSACGYISITFDPFTFLSLPIPIHKRRKLKITLHKLDGSIPIRYGIKASVGTTVFELKKIIQDLSGIKANRLIITLINHNIIQTIYTDQKNDSLYIF